MDMFMAIIRKDKETISAGEVSRFSSYGTLADGRNLPDICAPGASVISSVNTYCVTNPDMGYTPAALQAELKKIRRLIIGINLLEHQWQHQ